LRIVVGDIGGTHARFAIAELREGGPPVLGPMHKYRTGEHVDIASAWAQFAADCGEPLPAAAALAIAAPIEGEVLRFVNSHWEIYRSTLAEELGLEQLALLNDFGAVAHAVTVLGPGHFEHICGPAVDVPPTGITTILGPGTGLGAAILLRRDGRTEVIETEAAHMAFAPLDGDEEMLRDEVESRYGRASIERIVSGPGLFEIYREMGGGDCKALDASALWSAALDGSDARASDSLDMLVGCFGAVAGDICLAHGAMSLVVSSGLAVRMKDRLASPLFIERFLAKGRYRPRMERIPVLLATYPEPGLLGAAVAFQGELSETRHAGLDPASTFSSTTESKMDPGSSPG
jgi:glucokinase